MEGKTVSSELKLSELSRQNIRQSINQLHDRASSVLVLTLQWKEIEDHFNSIQRGIEQRAMELNSVQESAEQRLKEIKSREDELEVVKESVSWRIREAEEREKEFKFIQKKEIQDRKVEMEWIEKSRNQLDAESSAMGADVSFRVTMDGEALQLLLNDYCNDRDSIRQELLISLGFSPNPAKLVLDAVKGFYQGGLEFGEGIVRSSCVFLLEILLQIRPEISPEVRNEAMQLSLDWMKQMRKDSEHSTEVLGCLLLLGSYRLASAFDADELFRCLKIVSHHSQASQLLRALGLVDKLSGFIQNLVKQNKHIEAIRFIYDFQLLNEFPLEPLLEDNISSCRNAITNNNVIAEWE
ncbi:FRIGIDA-like protein 5 [Mercurialis annua]|uniref:FRIGIDA-like protein 5 n=1 Tax=Mercurialis annua TaxID=3986 RepID=UPI00215F0ACD|nr:FRIGIDA-like protein 5 [Mercurialis annua]